MHPVRIKYLYVYVYICVCAHTYYCDVHDVRASSVNWFTSRVRTTLGWNEGTSRLSREPIYLRWMTPCVFARAAVSGTVRVLIVFARIVMFFFSLLFFIRSFTRLCRLWWRRERAHRAYIIIRFSVRPFTEVPSNMVRMYTSYTRINMPIRTAAGR